jgi:vacuolar protein sorting-associated protein 35
MLSKGNPELAVKLYLHTALAADNMLGAQEEQPVVEQIVGELLSQAFLLHAEEIDDSTVQQRCIVNMVGTLLACQSVAASDYEKFITKTAQYAAKLLKKQDQCRMVALCAHLFYPVGKVVSSLILTHASSVSLLCTDPQFHREISSIQIHNARLSVCSDL